MVGVIAMAVVLWLGTSLAEGGDCNCNCVGKYGVCEDVSKLRTDVDANVGQLTKWNQYYTSVQTYHGYWEREATWIRHFEEELNATKNSCLASHRQLEESLTEVVRDVQKNRELLQSVQSEILDTVKNMAISLEALRKDVDIMQNDMGQLKQELSRMQTLCSPPCENGGQCVKNVCECPPSFTGDRCQQVMCSPPCENGGQCMTNNTCQCTISFAGDRCQQAVCSPPCENGGECMKNNICSCPTAFTGDRCQEGGPKCGVDFNIGGGNTSSILVWPWMAAVYKNDTRRGYRHFCGGSVIHRHFVLTSAWCVNAYGSSGLSVKLGLSDLKNGTHLREHRVQSTHTHPQFKTGSGYNNYDYDIGLLELENPIPFGPFVRPVCLPPPEIPQGEPFYKPQSTAKGVRLDRYLSSPQTASPTVLDLTVLPREECRRMLKEEDWEKYFPSPDLSFCTESSPPTCLQLGSPVMESRVEGGGTRTWTQVGIQSYTPVFECKYHFSPRLDHLRAWVDATIAASSRA